jgi:hypothetical protein
VCRRGDRNPTERIFREVRRRTSSFSNTFSNAKLPTAESWSQAFAVWWSRRQPQYDPPCLRLGTVVVNYERGATPWRNDDRGVSTIL